MLRKISAKLLAAALFAAPIALIATPAPVAAQGSLSVSFGYFHDELAPYGRWYHHARWGDVWHPTRVERDFRPYSRGHWDYTDRYGWVWSSDYEWSDVADHYGRWVYDPNDGWLWVPGYVWAPAWVIWRSSPGYVGWLPMPPDDRFLAGDEDYRSDWNDWDRGYGYADWYGPNYGANWLASIAVFVEDRHFADRDFVRYEAPSNQLIQISRNATNITNYVTVNNYIVNRSVDVGRIERASGRRITAVPEQTVIRTQTPVTPVNMGREIQVRERANHGGDPRASAKERPVAFTPAREEQVKRERQQQAQGGQNPPQQGQQGQQGPREQNARQGQNQPQQQGQPAQREQAQQQGQQGQRGQSQREQAQQPQQAQRGQAQQQKEQAQQPQQAQRQQAQRDQAQQAQREQQAQQAQQAQRDQAQQQQQQGQREQAQREQAQPAQKDQREQAQREQAQRQQAQREQAQPAQKGQREQAQQEQAQRQQAQREQAQPAQRGQREQAQPAQPSQPAQAQQAQRDQQAQREEAQRQAENARRDREKEKAKN